MPPPESDVPQRESAGHGMPRRGLQRAVGPDTCAVMLAQPLVGEQSQPSKPPCPSQHPHVAVLVTLRLIILDFFFCYYVIYSINKFLYLFHDKPCFTEHNFDYVRHFLFRIWFTMVSGNLNFPSETYVKSPVFFFFFTFFLNNRFV